MLFSFRKRDVEIRFSGCQWLCSLEWMRPRHWEKQSSSKGLDRTLVLRPAVLEASLPSLWFECEASKFLPFTSAGVGYVLVIHNQKSLAGTYIICDNCFTATETKHCETHLSRRGCLENVRIYPCQPILQTCWEAEHKKKYLSVHQLVQVFTEMHTVYLPDQGHVFRKLARAFEGEVWSSQFPQIVKPKNGPIRLIIYWISSLTQLINHIFLL